MKLVREAEAKERDPQGAIPELVDVIGSELLDDVKQRAQRAWLRVFGAEVIKRELPMAYAKWETDERRSEMGSLPLFLYSWFSNASKGLSQEKPPAGVRPIHAARGALRDSKTACRPSLHPQICAVHRSGERCEIEGRT